MSKLWLFTLLGTFTGVVGTGAGGALAFAFPAREGKFGQLLDFSGGLMLAIVCFDLLPEAFSLAPLPVVLAGVAAGAGMIMLVSRLEGHMHLAHHGLRLSALSVTLGIAVHNLPEGLAVGTALSEAQIESLVIAKGYDDCVTYINDGVVCVAVSAPAEGLSDADAALISDIVTSQTDYMLSQVRIIEVKP